MMYEFLLRMLPAPLANLLMACWYGALLLSLWLTAPSALNLAFRYGEM
jgi:hypothetical protein